MQRLTLFGMILFCIVLWADPLFSATLELFPAGEKAPCSIPEGPTFDIAQYTTAFYSNTDQFPESAFDGNWYFKSGVKVPDSITIRINCKKDIYGDAIHESHTSDCRNGTWTPSLPDCKERCGKLPFAMGYPLGRKPGHATYKHGYIITYRCPSGQRLIGKNNIVCNDGKWSPIKFRCVKKQLPKPVLKKCKKLTIDGAVEPTTGDVPNGTVLQYQCLTGRELIGNNTVICNNGTWSEIQFKCQITPKEYEKCGTFPYRPEVYTSVRRQQNTLFEHGSTVVYRCRYNKRMVGNNTIVCDNGRWTDIQFQCLDKNEYQTCGMIPYHSKVYASVRRQPNTSFKHGFTVEYRCRFNKRMVGNNTIVCDNGRWTEFQFQCLDNNEYQTCGMIPYHSEVYASVRRQPNTSFKHGFTVEYRCRFNKRMVGNNTIVCDNGRWTGFQFQCLDKNVAGDCALAQDIEGAELNGHTLPPYPSGSVLRYSCVHGRELVGNNTVVCTNGQWSPVNFKCELPPVDGEFSEWTAWRPCSATCGTGSQSRSRDCTNPAPQYGGRGCLGSANEIQDCNTNPCPVDGGFSEWTAWRSCSVTCGTGSQSRSRDCTNPAPQYGGRKCLGDKTEIQTCSTNACPGIVYKEPCEPLNIKGASMDITPGYTRHTGNIPSGTAVKYSCVPGMKMNGNRTVVCNNGKWSEVKFTCRREILPKEESTLAPPVTSIKEYKKCNKYKISGAKPNRRGRKFVHGTVVEYACRPGRKLVGDNKLECRDGRWTEVKFFCMSRRDVKQILNKFAALPKAQQKALCEEYIPN